MSETKNAPTPIEDEVYEVIADPILTPEAKQRKMAGIKAGRTIEKFRECIPITFTRETEIGTLSITVNAVDNRVANRELEGAIGLNITASLNGNLLKVDGRREFINPPIRFITPDGENETTNPARTGLGIDIPARTYRWREDPVSCLLRDLGEQIKSELETKRG